MIKKTITFKDLDGNPVTDDFYFALNAAEIAESVVTNKSLMDFFDKISQLMEAGEDNADAFDGKIDGMEVMHVFKSFIALSVGKRSEDGRRFIKNEDIRDSFMQTDAYPVLFMELCTDSSKAAEFINGVVPGDLQDIVAKLPSEVQAVGAPAKDEPEWLREGRVPTQAELENATPEQLRVAFKLQQEFRDRPVESTPSI